MRNTIAALLLALSLAGCGSANPAGEEIIPLHQQIGALKRQALDQYYAGDVAAAKDAITAAQALIPHTETALYDHNLLYPLMELEADLAWLTLAGGDVPSGVKRYEALIEQLERHEKIRQKHAQDKASTGDQTASFVAGMWNFQMGYAMSGDFSSAAQAGLNTYAKELRQAPGAPEAPQLLPTGAVGDQYRFVALPSMGPFMNIGRLVRNGGSCTAGLVGPGIALTNAHCLADHPDVPSVAKGSWPRRTDDFHITFEGLNGPDRVNVVRTILPHANGTRWNVRYKGDFTDDWAFAILDRHPIGRGYFGVLPPSVDAAGYADHIVTAGHSGDLNDGRYITAHWGCDFVVAGPNFRDNCQTYGGSSGTPVFFADGADHWTLLGVHSFSRKNADPPWAGGVDRKQFYDVLQRLIAEQERRLDATTGQQR